MATLQPRGTKWRAIVRRKGFKALTRTFPTKTTAKEWAERMERELGAQEAKGGVREFDAYTVTQLVDWYKRYVGSLKTVSKTQTGNLTRVSEGLGHLVASKLTAGDVVEYTRKRRQGEHFTHGKPVPSVTGATMNVELGFLGEMLRLATSMGKLTLDREPVADARPSLRVLKLVSKSRKRDRRPTSKELDSLRARFDESEWRCEIPMSDIVDFAIGTGKRESEITRLLWEDLDLTTRTALLRDAKHPRDKDGNHQRFPLLGDMWELVQRQPRTHTKIFPYNSKSVGTAFRRNCVALGIKNLTFHDLRHEATSRLFEQGYAIEQVAAVTLHRSWEELKRYTQLRPETLHRDELSQRRKKLAV
ncbi:tyrosine-type recombinase/integrase [Lysobacter gummosus]|uniref:tyrosine-type recombinase/integrase n=1 Tax=Lysobacter gummosus TaxID=262324 RepID=UPI00363CB42A